MEFTPENITALGEHEIFVFGSNLAGHHAGGAARIARKRFGAVMGNGVGLQGRSYAIPTMQGGVETIKPYVDDFIRFARNDFDHTYFVTRIGCGIAGFTDEEIAPLFMEALKVDNIILPKSFVEVLTSDKYAGSYLPNWQKHYSSYDMAIDCLLTLNRFNAYTPRDSERAIQNLEEMLGQVSRNGSNIMTNVMYKNYPQDDEEGTEETVGQYLVTLAKDIRYCHPYYAPCLRYIYSITAEVAHTMLELKNWSLPEPQTGFFGGGLFYQLYCIMTGRWNCGDNSYILDNLENAFPIFKGFLEYNWQSLFTNGKLDEQKVIGFFSNPLIWTEWKKEAKHGQSLYRCISWVLMILCEQNNAVYRWDNNGVYVPRRNFSLPVFDSEIGRVHFPNFALKKAFIEQLLPND